MWGLEQLSRQTGADTHTLTVLRKLDQCLIGKKNMTEDDITSIQAFLLLCIGKMTMNRQLESLAMLSRSDTGIATTVITAIRDIAYRTRHLAILSERLDKLWEDFQQAMADGEDLRIDEKISLVQYGVLHDLASLKPSLMDFKAGNLFENNSPLKQLFRATCRASTIIRHLDETFDTTWTRPAGTMIVDNTQSKAAIYDITLSFFETGMAMVVTEDVDASTELSVDSRPVDHIVSPGNPVYPEEKFSLRNFLYADVFCIQLEALIDSDAEKLLAATLGEDWLQQLERQYAAIERELHDGALNKHSHIIAEGGLIRFSQIGTSYLRGGHLNLFFSHHLNAEVRDSMYSRGKWEAERCDTTRILCSEFVGLTVIAAIEELNDKVKKWLRTRGVEEQDIPEAIIRSPMKEKETLYLLTPSRLIEAMKERGALVQVSSPSGVRDRVKRGEINEGSVNPGEGVTPMPHNDMELNEAVRGLRERPPGLRPPPKTG